MSEIDSVETEASALEAGGPRPASEPEPGAAPRRCALLTVLSGPERGVCFRLDAPETVVGKGGSIDAVIADAGLSRRHARFLRRGSLYYVEDLNSSDGTYHGGRRIVAPARLIDGDRIRLGRYTLLRFTLHEVIDEWRPPNLRAGRLVADRAREPRPLTRCSSPPEER